MANKELNLVGESSNGLGNYSYTEQGLIERPMEHNTDRVGNSLFNPGRKVKSEDLDAIIRALGTMVIINEGKINPTTMQKEYTSPVQQPILLGDKREKVLNKLVELIDSL